MSIYMDRHDIPGATASDVAQAHQENLKIQDQFHCRALTYWFDEKRGAAFCLVEAPDANAVQEMHDLAHGLIPHQILEVESSVVESFLGRISDPARVDETEHDAISESAFRAIMCADMRMITGPAVDSTNGSAPTGLSDLRKLVLETCDRYSGRVVEHAGRGMLISFGSTSRALDCASGLLEQVNRFNGGEYSSPAQIRIGLSLGAPVTGSAELFGETVQTARRLADIAQDGQVILSSSIGEVPTLEFPAGRDNDSARYITPDEESFLHKLMRTTEEVWTDPNLQVPDFGRKIGLSKSQLYRKTTTLTGMAPSAFLQEYRLRRAAERLAAQRASITEIAYDAGFGSLSYFTKCFRKRFGLLPSQYSCRSI